MTDLGWHLPRQFLFEICKSVCADCYNRGVLGQLFRDNLIQGIRSGVVIIKVKSIILDGQERWNASLIEWVQVGSGVLGKRENTGTTALQDGCDRCEQRLRLRAGFPIQTKG